MTNALIAIIIGCVLFGAVLLCFSIDFVGDGAEPDDYIIDWPKAIIGTALLAVAAVVAAVGWPV